MDGIKRSAAESLSKHKWSVVKTVCGLALLGIIVYVFYIKVVKPITQPGYKNNKEIVDTGVDSPDSDIIDIMYFYTTWCPYCKKARPEWDKFKSQWEDIGFGGYDIRFSEVDCDINEAAADKYNVDGYPTIKMVKNKKVIDYDAKPELTSLNKFLKSSLV